MLHKISAEQNYLNGKTDDASIIEHYQTGRKEDMKSKGAVYTPPWVVATMLEKLDLTTQEQRIIEPACGHGSFILPLIQYAKRKLDMDWEQAYDWFLSSVTGCDIDPETVEDLKLLVTMLFKRNGVDRASSYEMDNLLVEDGLKIDISGYDIAIGNPPYIRTQLLDPAYLNWLRSTFEIAQSGNIDIYYAFLDRYVTSIRQTVFIVPNGWIKASGARQLREKVFRYVEDLTDFKSRLVFPAARTYTCIIATSQAHEGACTYRVDADGPSKKTNWVDLTGAEIHSAPKRAKSGIATLADKCFAVQQNPEDGSFFCEFEGTRFPVEANIVRPLIKITKIGDGAQLPEKFILFPYEEMSGNSVYSELEMKSLFPKAYTYLKAVKHVLTGRDKGKTDKYPQWFAYGRSQGLHDLSSSDVVFIPTMIGGASVPKRIDTRSMTQAYGAPLFVSGFAVVDRPEVLEALLSEDFRDYVKENGAAKPGASELYYAISSKHVNSFIQLRFQDA